MLKSYSWLTTIVYKFTFNTLHEVDSRIQITLDIRNNFTNLIIIYFCIIFYIKTFVLCDELITFTHFVIHMSHRSIFEWSGAGEWLITPST